MGEELANYIPDWVIKVSVLLAASSGIFYFTWERIVKPLLMSLYTSLHQELIVHSEYNHDLMRCLILWLRANSGNIHFNRRHESVRIDDTTVLTPANKSWFLLRVKGLPFIMCLRTLEQRDMSPPMLIYTLHVLSAKKSRVHAIIEDIEKYAVVDTSIVQRYRNGWFETSSRRKPVENVYSASAREFIADVGWFLQQRDYYEKRNLPYRRGYLLTGSPGTGKSAIVAYASQLYDLPMYYVTSLSDPSGLMEGIAVTARRHTIILLIEDIDLVGINVDDVAGNVKDERNQLPATVLRELMNRLDGVTEADNFVFVCTSNERAELDEALLRPGRIDVQLTIDLLTHDEQLDYLEFVYGDEVVLPDGTVLKPRPIAELTNLCATAPKFEDVAERLIC